MVPLYRRSLMLLLDLLIGTNPGKGFVLMVGGGIAVLLISVWGRSKTTRSNGCGHTTDPVQYGARRMLGQENLGTTGNQNRQCHTRWRLEPKELSPALINCPNRPGHCGGVGWQWSGRIICGTAGQ
jgi:hypothetical protein